MAPNNDAPAETPVRKAHSLRTATFKGIMGNYVGSPAAQNPEKHRPIPHTVEFLEKVDATISERDELRGELEDTQASLSSSESNNKNLESSVRSLKRSNDAQGETIANHSDRITSLETQNANLRARLAAVSQAGLDLAAGNFDGARGKRAKIFDIRRNA